jgi:hypothetical protein
MKNIFLFIAIAFALATTTTSCYRVTPDGNQESVLIQKPFFFGHGGVDEDPITSGATWCVWTTDHEEFILTPRQFTEGFDDMITDDNINIDFNAYIKIQVIKGRTPELLKNFGNDSTWYKNNIAQTFRTMVRNKASEHTCFELASDRAILDSISNLVLVDMQKYVKTTNIPVEIQSVIIGAATPPQDVLAETVHTAAQKQRILTQNATKQAEDARKAAEIAKADADKAYQTQMNMSVDQYLQLRSIEIQKEKVQLIKDKQNVSIIFGDVQPVKQVQ